MRIIKEQTKTLLDGTKANIYKLTNSKGLSAKISNLGGSIISLFIPDKNGCLRDVVLGFDDLNSYKNPGPYLGSIIGRHANRIEDAKFTLNGKNYALASNNGKNHLHGGIVGFDKVLWRDSIIEKNGIEYLQLDYISKNGEEGYPGNLSVKVFYTLTNQNELIMEYYATTDMDTVVNLTNHSYFNLAGHSSGNILKHKLMINADKFTPINQESLPTGEIANVEGTSMDFRTLKKIEEAIRYDDIQIIYGNGYDHNWILNVTGKTLQKAAELFEPESGRFMEVFTTKPGVQFYSGNYLNNILGKEGAIYNSKGGLCLETQYYPNALKHTHFPSPVLRVGEKYFHSTVFRFSCFDGNKIQN